MKTSLKLTVLFVLLTSISVAQGIYNNGGKIVIGTGAVVHINGSTGNFRNETSGSNGEVLLSGSLIVKGNLINNVGSEDVFNSPAAGSEVILSGAAAQTLGGSTTATFRFGKLTLNNSNGLTLGSSVQVKNLLTFQSGIINTDANTVTIGLSGTVSGTSSTAYISGKLARVINTTGTNIAFPIGKGGNYRPLSINFSSLTGTSTITTEQIETLLPGPPPTNVTFYPDRYWQISESGGSNLAYTLTLDGTGFTTSAIKKMIKGNGTTNTDYDVTYSNPYFTNESPFNSFSNFGIGEYCVGQTVVFPVISAVTYGDQPFTVSATGGASGNPVIFTSSDPEVATCTGTNGTTITIIKAGNCTISAIQAGNAIYCQGRTDRVLTVNPKPITITAHAGQTKVYGNSDPVSFTYTWSPSLVGSDVISGTMSRTTGENAGDYAYTLGSLDAGANYTLSVNATPVFTITPKPLTPVITAEGKCYDGSAAATLTSQTLTGVISPDVVTLLVTSSAFDNANAGTGKTVTASGLTLGGAGALNYIPAAPTANTTANIHALPLPVIDGAAGACSGSTGNVYSTEAGNSIYTWTVSAGGSITSGGGLTDNSVTVTWNVIGDQSVSVNYTDAHDCRATIATEKSIAVTSRPIPTLSGAETPCVNHTNMVYATEPGNSNYIWTVSPGGTITAGGATADDDVTVTWTTSGTQSVSVSYTINGGCSAASPTVKNVTVIPSPAPEVTGPESVCALTSGNVYTTETGMTSYVWIVSSGGTITSGGTSTDHSVTVTWNTAGARSVSVNYQNSYGCYGASPAVRNVTVKPLPVPTISGTSPVCGNLSTVDYTTEAGKSNYAWTLTSGGNITSGSGTNSIAIAWSTNGIHTITVTYTDNNGCAAIAPTEKSVGVGPLPVVELSGPSTPCVNRPGYVYTTQSGKSNYTWYVSPGGTITSGGTLSDNTVEVTWNTAGAQSVSVNYQNEYGCSASSAEVANVTAIAAPVPTMSGPASVCSGVSGNVYTTQAGQNDYTWVVTPGGSITSGGGSNNNSVTVTWNDGVAQYVSVNYKNSNGCEGEFAAIQNVIVNPGGQVNQPDNQVVCNNEGTAPVAFVTINTGGTTAYAWTNNNTGIGLRAQGTGDITGFTAVNTGTSPVVATIVVTPTFTYGQVSCTGPSKSFTITVNPTGQVNQPGNQLLCNGSTTTAVSFGTISTGGTTSYAWTNDNTGTGLRAQGTGDITGFVATNTGTSPIVSTIVVTPFFANSGVNCSGPSKSFSITVNPTSQVNQPASQVVCNYANTALVTFGTANTGGTTSYTWTNDNTGTGLGAQGTGNIPAFIATNPGASPVVSTIVVTPTFANGQVSCTGTSKSFTITVNPTGQVNQPVDQVICNNASASVIFATNNTSGTTSYTWTNNQTSIGLGAQGTGNITAFTATNTGTSPVLATIEVTPYFTNGLVGCTGPSKNFTITVNPTAQVDQPSSQLLCNGSTTNAITFTTVCTGGATSYSWTNSLTSIGIGAQGTGDIPAFTATNTGAAPVIATIVVTPTFTNGGVSCTGPTRSFTITVNPTGQVNQPDNQIVCNNANTALVTFTTTQTGGTTTYSWTNNNTGIGLRAQGTGNIGAFTAINPGTSPVVATIVVTPTFTNGSGSCTGPSKSFTITVNPSLHWVTIEASANNKCAATVIGYRATPENGGTNPSYQWKVNGINAGNNNATFVYIPVNGDVVTCVMISSEPCTGGIPVTSNAVAMTVYPYLEVGVSIASPVNHVCAGTPVTVTATPVNGGNSPSYQWMVNGINAGTNNPGFTFVPANGDQVSCNMTSNEQCVLANPATSNTLTMAVTPLLPVSVSIISSANPVCTGTQVSFTATPVNGGSNPVFQWKVNAVNVGDNNPVYVYVPSNGDIITCVLTANESCMSGNPATSNAISLTVNPLPVPVITGSVNVLSGTSGVVYATQPGQSDYSWNISAGGTITAGGTTADPTATVTWNTAGAQWISVNYANLQTGCRGAAATQLNVTVTQASFIAITSPNGGEAWRLGSVQNITWNDNITGDVTIELFKDGEYQQTIAGATPSTGTFEWTIARNQQPGADYKVKIYSTDDPALYVMSSSVFKIIYDIPIDLEVRDIPISDGVNICFDALQTIFVAGGGHTFVVQPGGSATFIAGQNILYLPGTTVQPGGYMHGYITQNAEYCWSVSPSFVSTSVSAVSDTSLASLVPCPVSRVPIPVSRVPIPDSARFMVYPNPTDGKFMVEYVGKDQPGTIQVEVLGMKGERILTKEMTDVRKQEFSLEGRANGIYLVRIVAEEGVKTVRVLKR